MQCPSCTGTELLKKNRNDIEIDYCPDCRGVWLDRGELEKIIERSTADITEKKPEAGAPKPGEPSHKHKRNLITELFDF